MTTFITGEIGTTGVKLVRQLDDPAKDIAWAVRNEHGCSGDNTCDIAYALKWGFSYVAAWLLVGATECPLLAAVLDAHDVDVREFPPGLAEFRDRARNYPQCPDCEARLFGRGQCYNCHGPAGFFN